jgi:hypothetical protein
VVPTRHARAESEGGANRKRDGAQVSRGGGAGSYVCVDAREWRCEMGLGCLEGEARRGAQDAREWSSRHRHFHVLPGASESLLVLYPVQCHWPNQR